MAEGLKNRGVVTDDTTQRLMPHNPLGVREAIHRALAKIEQHDVETRWSVAGPVPGDPSWSGGTVFTDGRSVEIDAEPPQVYAAVCRIGGGNGWYAGDMLWRLRGWMDTLVGTRQKSSASPNSTVAAFVRPPKQCGVADVDRSLLAAGYSREALERTIRQLDDLQDRERQRPPLVETIFHPVPSVESRLRGPHTAGTRGAWDAARTAVYLSSAGISLLGRAVHCNAGRPALWTFLPID